MPEAWREEFRGFNGPRLFHDYFEEAMERLRSRFLKQPVYGEVIPVPKEEDIEVERRVEEAVSEGAPTEEELSAWEYFTRAITSDGSDYAGKIADYTEANRLYPDFDDAYLFRGIARFDSGDLDGAIADYTHIIKRGNQSLHAFNNRGEAYFVKKQYREALFDFEAANKAKPDIEIARAGSAITYHSLGQIEQAQTICRSLISNDERFQDAEWVRKELEWAEPLVEEVRKLIAGL